MAAIEKIFKKVLTNGRKKWYGYYILGRPMVDNNGGKYDVRRFFLRGEAEI